MPFDGGFLHKTVTELNEAVDSHIDKIYQPSREELVLVLRKKGFVKRLLICIKPGSARIQFTENKYENPQTPPMFCMLVRKHLSAARLISVTQSSLERVVVLTFSGTNELGDIAETRIIAEFIGNKTNIILVGADGRIIDSLRRSDPETADRLILTGAVYTLPASTGKLNPLTSDLSGRFEGLYETEEIIKALLNTLEGFSPLICREIAYRAETEGLNPSLTAVISNLKDDCTPTLLLKNDGSGFDFSYTDITQYGDEFKRVRFDSCSALMDAFFTARDTENRVNRAAGDIIRLINNLRTRTEKKLAIRLNDLKKCENRETLRIYGELIKANLYRIENGASFAEVENYYDDLKLIRIPLNPALSPSNNAAKYFKDYKKTYTAEQTLTALTERDKEELVYFDSVLDSIHRSETLAEIAEIREELTIGGYIKGSVNKKKSNAVPKLKEYTSSEGYKIIIGKNNRQNDYITTSLAAKTDLWFHTKNIPGSHVVVMCKGEPVSDETILFAASLAATNSKAASSAQVPVDYTPIRFVKKPNGAKAGMVIYTTNKTVYVTPNKGEDL